MWHKHNKETANLKLPAYCTLILKFFWLNPQMQTNNPAQSHIHGR